ncbi:hypothetical protein ACFL0F_00680 [Patescibacteria group bacterium]
MVNENRRQVLFYDWVLDLLIYIVILNLFMEYSSAIYFETFTLSIFTAVILKALLSLVISLEHKVRDFFKKYKGKAARYLYYLITFLILFFSKFVIIEVIDIIFGKQVEIYGFVPLVLMIIAMIASRKIIEQIYKKL